MSRRDFSIQIKKVVLQPCYRIWTGRFRSNDRQRIAIVFSSISICYARRVECNEIWSLFEFLLFIRKIKEKIAVFFNWNPHKNRFECIAFVCIFRSLSVRSVQQHPFLLLLLGVLTFDLLLWRLSKCRCISVGANHIHDHFHFSILILWREVEKKKKKQMKTPKKFIRVRRSS